MEEHKYRALLHFLRRSNKTPEILFDVLAPEVQVLKDAYDQLDPKWNEDDGKFLQMMILDGCFIFEILRATNKRRQWSGTDQSSNDQDYAWNDPIFSHHGKLYIVQYLKRDMLMLENQIPILVLKKLLSVQNDPLLKKGKELTRLILKFFSQNSFSDEHLYLFNQCLHILDVHHKSLLQPPSKPNLKRRYVRQGEEEIIRSATELNEAGIKIEKSKTKSLTDISFHKGVLRLPSIVVDDALESLYLNLIAFERSHVGAGNEVTSFVFFMDNIIHNQRDVSLLHSCGIIQSALGGDKAIVDLFNSLSKDIRLDPESSLGQVHTDVSNYCQKPWNRWRAQILHTYATSPVWVYSTLGGISLFTLTAIQALFAVLSYIKQSTPGAG